MNAGPGQTGEDGDAGGLRASGRRNFLLGIANGAFVQVGQQFVNPTLVLAGFVYGQTQSTLLVGVLSTATALGHLWPQLYVSSLIEHLPRKKPFYIGASIIRVVMLLVMSLAMWLSGSMKGGWPLVAFFAAYFVFRSAQGAGSMPFFDLVGQSIASHRLGGFFALRSFAGQSLSVLGGFFIVQRIIAHLPAPGSYALLTAIALLLMGAGWGIWCAAAEKENPDPPPKRSLRDAVVGGVQAVRGDRNYRVLVLMRLLLRFNTLAFAFFVPYGVERLGAAGMAGVYVGVGSASRLASSLIWGKVSNAKGNRLCLALSGLLFALAPLAALIAPRLPEAYSLSLPRLALPLDLPLTVYLSSICLARLAMQGAMIARNSFMLEIAPSDRRPSYMAFSNTVAVPLTFLPTVAGLLVGNVTSRLDALFGIAAAAGILTFISALRLREVRQGRPAVGES